MNSAEAVVENRISQTNPRALRNPWVLGWIALVTIVLGVNALMITLAITTNPGLVEKDYYERGRDYERTLQTRMAARSALGWKISLDLAPAITRGSPAAINVIALDKAGVPLTNARVTIHAYRPSDANSDFVMPMAEKGAGQYVSDMTFPLKGMWDLIVDVKQVGNTFQVTRRISVLGS